MFILFMYENKTAYTMSLEDELREDMHMSSAAAAFAADWDARVIMRIAKNTSTEEHENAAICAAWYSESANRDKTTVANNKFSMDMIRKFANNATMEAIKTHDILEALRIKSYVIKPTTHLMKSYALKLRAKVDDEDAIAANIHVGYSVALATSISAVANVVGRGTLSNNFKFVMTIIARQGWVDALHIMSCPRAAEASRLAVVSWRAAVNAFPNACRSLGIANIIALRIAIQRAALPVKHTAKCKAALAASYGILAKDAADCDKNLKGFVAEGKFLAAKRVKVYRNFVAAERATTDEKSV
jgi:hypothetical protein